MKKATKKKIGIALLIMSVGFIWVGTHIIILLRGLSPEFIKAHAAVNLFGAGIYGIGYYLKNN